MTATILVVDDEPDLEALVLQKFRKQIRDGAVTFMFAHDGVEALQSIENHPHVDMVVSDINMPRMDGLSLLQKLQEAEDKKSTIIVSAYGDMSNIRTAMNRGAFDQRRSPRTEAAGIGGIGAGPALAVKRRRSARTALSLASRQYQTASLLIVDGSHFPRRPTISTHGLSSGGLNFERNSKPPSKATYSNGPPTTGSG